MHVYVYKVHIYVHKYVCSHVRMLIRNSRDIIHYKVLAIGIFTTSL